MTEKDWNQWARDLIARRDAEHAEQARRDAEEWACWECSDLQEAVNSAYSVLLCGPEVGGLETIEERVHQALLILGKHQTDIG